MNQVAWNCRGRQGQVFQVPLLDYGICGCKKIPTLVEMFSKEKQDSYAIQAISTPSVFFRSDFDDHLKRPVHDDSNSNISDISTNTMDTQVTSKYRPIPLTLKNSIMHIPI